ncbi:MAG: UDP-N-acetylglucosamine 1-carboxyvinyltransferase, partial [Sporomusaceae bacterium]|nr:UDP-N-acetylglucosamine 1-carboxyvinyltransferase [Sporomusaceae bacterium]
MEKFIVTGEVQLSGRIAVSGAKNATLPIMAAALLCEGKSVLYQVPNLRDIAMMQKIMELLGAKIVRDGAKMLIDTYSVSKTEIPELLMREMRASVFLMGPLLARFRRVRLSYPGGCAIGPRPINLHLKALEHLGAQIEESCGFIDAKADQLKGNEITFDFPSVGATENAMMAAVLAKGTTILHNAAREPEIVDLERFLNSMGAKVSGAGTDSIAIDGVTKLHGAEHRIMPDRIEAGTLLLAGAVTQGDVEVTNIHHSYLFSVIDKLRELGARISYYSDSIRLQAGMLSGIDVKTLPYPGFPTDLQAPMLSV